MNHVLTSIKKLFSKLFSNLLSTPNRSNLRLFFNKEKTYRFTVDGVSTKVVYKLEIVRTAKINS